MFESIPAFLTSLRQTSPIIFLGLCIASGIILFASPDLAATLGLDTFRDQYRPILGFTFVASASIVLVNGVWLAIKAGRKVVRRRKGMKVRHQSLHELTPDEKSYLAAYVLDDVNTQYMQIDDGIAGGLNAKGIIYRASNVGDMLRGWAYNIQPWAKDYLREHPHLLDGASGNVPGPRSVFDL